MNEARPSQLTWEHFDHSADIGVRGSGPTVEAALEQAAVALTAAVCELTAIEPHDAIQIECEAEGHEAMLIAWLNALIFEMAVRKMLFSKFTVRLQDNLLHGTAWGEPVDIARHQPSAEPKGATFTALSVVQSPNGNWTAQCVVDV